jgi:hypothetical protein
VIFASLDPTLAVVPLRKPQTRLAAESRREADLPLLRGIRGCLGSRKGRVAVDMLSKIYLPCLARGYSRATLVVVRGDNVCVNLREDLLRWAPNQ